MDMKCGRLAPSSWSESSIEVPQVDVFFSPKFIHILVQDGLCFERVPRSVSWGTECLRTSGSSSARIAKSSSMSSGDNCGTIAPRFGTIVIKPCVQNCRRASNWYSAYLKLRRDNILAQSCSFRDFSSDVLSRNLSTAAEVSDCRGIAESVFDFDFHLSAVQR